MIDDAQQDEPLKLLLFGSKTSGRCRRVEAWLAGVVQRRANHKTFRVIKLEEEEWPALFEQFEISEVPTLVVVGSKEHARLASPRTAKEIQRFLSSWMR